MEEGLSNQTIQKRETDVEVIDVDALPPSLPAPFFDRDDEEKLSKRLRDEEDSPSDASGEEEEDSFGDEEDDDMEGWMALKREAEKVYSQLNEMQQLNLTTQIFRGRELLKLKRGQTPVDLFKCPIPASDDEDDGGEAMIEAANGIMEFILLGRDMLKRKRNKIDPAGVREKLALDDVDSRFPERVDENGIQEDEEFRTVFLVEQLRRNINQTYLEHRAEYRKEKTWKALFQKQPEDADKIALAADEDEEKRKFFRMTNSSRAARGLPVFKTMPEYDAFVASKKASIATK